MKKTSSQDLYINNEELCIGIAFENDKYIISNDKDKVQFFIIFWNNNGESINYYIVLKVNGNSGSIKYLYDLGWTKNENGSLIFDKEVLVKFHSNHKENYHRMIRSCKKLFSNGLNIKL